MAQKQMAAFNERHVIACSLTVCEQDHARTITEGSFSCQFVYILDVKQGLASA